MIPVLTPDEMAAVDAGAPEPIEELIQRAGRAVARTALDMLGGSYGRVVRVIVGSGNNGNDGRVAAEVLRHRGVHVEVIDAADVPVRLRPSDLVIDAAFGTGFRGAWTSPDVGAAQVLAVDIPSGVDARDGTAGAGVLRADRTITFQALKPGHLFGVGVDLAGRVEVADIGLDVSAASIHVVDRDDLVARWPRRRADAHKWNGAVRVVAGSAGMTGAATLCAEAAARSGAGLVKLSAIDAVAVCRPEIIQQTIQQTEAGSGWADAVLADLDRFAALAVGPGIGRTADDLASTRSLIEQADLPVVIDADGLFALAHAPGGPAAVLARRRAASVLTPHDGEFRELSGAVPGTDRIAATRQLAAELDCTVLLKGRATVVAGPDGRVLVVNHGDERLATAGAGDVLTGIIATALAAGLDPLWAAAGGAFLHAAAGRTLPPLGLLAGDLVGALPNALAGVLSSG